MKLEINIIVAVDENNAIGNKGDLLDCFLLGDKLFFKKITTGYSVIAGRITFESYPENYRPLPERDNDILTKDPEYKPSKSNERTFTHHSMIAALNAVAERGCTKAFIGGGGQIYQEILAMGIVDTIYLTKIKGSFEADTYFPTIDLSQWDEILLKTQEQNEKNSHEFSIYQYSRKN